MSDTIVINSTDYNVSVDPDQRVVVEVSPVLPSAGGGSGLTEIVQDTTPQLGGDLDAQLFSLLNLYLMQRGTSEIQFTPTGGISLNPSNDQLVIFGTTNQQDNKIINVLDPTDDQDAATKKYVDDIFSGAAGLTISATAPSTPAIGDLWLDTSGAPDQFKVYTDDGWESALYKSEADDPNNNIGFNDGYF